MDWRDLTAKGRIALAMDILASLASHRPVDHGSYSSGLFFRQSRTRGSYDPRLLAELAKEEMAWRAKRSKFVALDIYSDGAWGMLLDLYINRVRGRNVSVTSACLASDMPPTTALRYIAMLEAEGMIDSETPECDLRVRWLRLSETGLRAIEGYLIAKADHASHAGGSQRPGEAPSIPTAANAR